MKLISEEQRYELQNKIAEETLGWDGSDVLAQGIEKSAQAQLASCEKEAKLERLQFARTMWDEVACPLCQCLNPQHAPREGYAGCQSCQEKEDILGKEIEQYKSPQEVEQIKREAEQEGIKKVVEWVEGRKRTSREVAELFIGDIKVYTEEWQAKMKEWGIEEK